MYGEEWILKGSWLDGFRRIYNDLENLSEERKLKWSVLEGLK